MRARILSAAMFLGFVSAFAAPALAQMNIAVPTEKIKTQEDVDQASKRDQDYKATLQKLPDQKVSNDPWGNVRSNAPAPVDPKTKKKKTTAQQP